MFIRTHTSVLTSTLALALTAAACDDGATPAPALPDAAASTDAAAPPMDAAGPPLFVVSTQKLSPMGTYSGTYIQTLPALEGRVDIGKAVELGPGYWYVTSFGPAVFVGSPTDATVTRYEPDAAGTLRRGPSISFQPDGAKKVVSFVILTPTLAVTMLGDAAKIVMFDPTTMQKLPSGVIDISSMRLDGLDPTSYDPQVVGKKIYFPTFYIDFKTYKTRKQAQVIILDTTTGTAKLIEDDRCAHVEYLRTDEKGDIYVQGDNLGQYVEGPPTCLLKIPAGTDAFDKTWIIKFADILGGRDTTTLAYLGGGKFATIPLYPERLDPNDPLSQFFGAVRKWWIFDVTTKTAVEAPGLPYTGYLFWPLALDGIV